MRNFLVMSLLLVDLAACSRTPTSPLPPPISGIRIGTPIDEALAELYKDSELRDKISVAHFLLPTTKLPPTQAEAVAVLNSIRSNSPSPAFTTNLVMATKRYERVEIHSDKEGRVRFVSLTPRVSTRENFETLVAEAQSRFGEQPTRSTPDSGKYEAVEATWKSCKWQIKYTIEWFHERNSPPADAMITEKMDASLCQ